MEVSIEQAFAKAVSELGHSQLTVALLNDHIAEQDRKLAELEAVIAGDRPG